MYRRVHGACWDPVEGIRAACGVTIHLIDTGADTGPILAQAMIGSTEEDSFVTYPLLQLAAGIPWLQGVLQDVCADRVEPRPGPAGASRLWSHPTLREYLWHRVRHGLK